MSYFQVVMLLLISVLFITLHSVYADEVNNYSEDCDPSEPGINPIKHYHALYDSAAGKFSYSKHNFESFEAWQEAFRHELKEVLGLNVMERELADFQIQAEKISTLEMDDHIREEWLLQVEPTMTIPFYLLRPLGADLSEVRLPLVLTPHGHNHPELYVGIYNNDAERQSIQDGDRDIAVQAVREGYLVISPTVRGFGDTRNKNDIENNRLHSCRIRLLHGLLVGRTAIGERVWDISRLIDWALENEAVDSERIAITGNSGGGTISVFAPACDTRIRVAMPASYFCTFVDSIGSIHHCDCNYVPGMLQLGEMYDVAGLIAPRPFRAINGVEDAIFPIEATRHAYNELRKIYAVAGAELHCELYEGDGGHRYYREGAWPFLQQHFAR